MASAAEPLGADTAVLTAPAAPQPGAPGPGSAGLRRFAAMPPLLVLRELDSSLHGLDEVEAQSRLARYGDNTTHRDGPRGVVRFVTRAVLDPFVVVLFLLGAVSAATGDWPGVVVIGVLALVSCGLRVGQEYQGVRAAAALADVSATTITVLRRARPGTPAMAREVPTDQLVPGDVVRICAGDAVPADLRLLRSTGLTLSQALLTGESLPVTKHATMTAQSDVRDHGFGADTSLFGHPRLCLLGATVVAGAGTAVVVATGADTHFAISNRDVAGRRGQTAFHHGVKGVSWTLIRLMAAIVPLVLALNEVTDDNWLQACLFAVAVAVGLVPEMLPVVVTTALVRASTVLRAGGVVVKALPAIHNIGAMNVLCIDKTGTLTLDRLGVTRCVDPLGRPDTQPLRYAYLNAAFGIEHTDPPLADAVDEALLHHARQLDLDDEEGLSGLRALGFDATRRRSTVALREAPQWGRELLITKGAAEEVLACCTHARIDGADLPLDAGHRQRLTSQADTLHAAGLRVLAVAIATRPATTRPLGPGDEIGMTLIGYVGLVDEPKPSARGALAALADNHVTIKILTGDHPLAAARSCQDAGLDPGTPVCGHDIDSLDDRQLAALAARTTLFARVDARQKARIVTALRGKGHTVGYLGDGVNDAPALHAADVGACVDSGVDIARATSDVLLTGKDLAGLVVAVTAGRHAFANIIKYVKITVSSNVGNVCSVLAASALLPFLPMLPLQILIQNLLFDVSQLSLAFDHSDPDTRARPRTFASPDLTRFVLCFGAINTLADLATFVVLGHMLGGHIGAAGQVMFHTGWFIENLLTQALAVHLLRRRGATGWSWAARPVLLTTAAVAALSLSVAFTPLGGLLSLHALPPVYYLWLAVILIAYAAALAAGKYGYQRVFRTWL